MLAEICRAHVLRGVYLAERLASARLPGVDQVQEEVSVAKDKGYVGQRLFVSL